MSKTKIVVVLVVVFCTSLVYLGCELVGGSYDILVPPNQSRLINHNGGDWKITLDRGGWRGSTVTVEITITNVGSNLATFSSLFTSIGMVAVDSYGKPIKAKTGWYESKEMYPGDSVSGKMKFAFSFKSGETKLYLSKWTATRYDLFDLGSPARGGQ